ncbi:MAG TPA: N-acetylmuramoyl-L-alanine amidase [Anaerolineae bacterium]|nr:N-acetylmuramoyl-L-alanine amidase [Anaerolineae bacterium]
MVKSSVMCFLLSFLFLAFFSGYSCDTLVFADSEKFDSFNNIYFGSVPYISLVDLAEAYRVYISYDPHILCMTAQRGEKKLEIVNHSRIAVLNGTAKNIVLPARLVRGTMFVPVTTFLPLFSELIPATLTWDEKKHAVRVSGYTTTIKDVTYEQFSNGTRICIALAESLPHDAELRDNNWLALNFADGSFNPDTLFPSPPSGLVRDTRCLRYDRGALLLFAISDETDNFSISSTSDPHKVLISLFKKRTNVPITPSNLHQDNLYVEPPVDDKLWRIDTVVIDPGHGGKDSGAVGPSKIMEKDIVLDVALELKKIIDKHGEVKAVLTREKDEFVPLYKRARIANEKGGKLFISIHVNAHRNKNATGMEVYFLSAAKTEDARAVAQRENASIRYEENLEYYANQFNNSIIPDELKDSYLDMVSNVFIKESQDMCSILLDTTCSATRQQRRGVKQAGFYVMLGTQATMPSVLFEIGFISNPEEEKLLNRSSYQKRLAQAIYDTIIKFKQRHERDLFLRSE